MLLLRVFSLQQRAGRPDGQTAINETIIYYHSCFWCPLFSTSPWHVVRKECASLPPLHSYKACRCKRCKGMVLVSTMQPGAKMQPELLGSCCLAASDGFRANCCPYFPLNGDLWCTLNWLYLFYVAFLTPMFFLHLSTLLQFLIPLFSPALLFPFIDTLAILC